MWHILTCWKLLSGYILVNYITIYIHIIYNTNASWGCIWSR